jgi:hypothetical protein
MNQKETGMYKIMLIYNLYFLTEENACRKNSRKVGNLMLVLCYIRKTVPRMTSLEALALPPYSLGKGPDAAHAALV